MGRDDHPGQCHFFQMLSKSLHGDDYRRNPRFFNQPGNVSDRHVANRSNRHQQDRIDMLLFEYLNPLGGGSI